jgi:hypothetical protein
MMLDRANEIRKEKEDKAAQENKTEIIKHGADAADAVGESVLKSVGELEDATNSLMDKVTERLHARWKALGQGLPEDLVTGFMEGSVSAADLMVQGYESILQQREQSRRMAEIFGAAASQTLGIVLGAQFEREQFLVAIKPVIEQAAARQMKKDMVQSAIEAQQAAEEAMLQTLSGIFQGVFVDGDVAVLLHSNFLATYVTGDSRRILDLAFSDSHLTRNNGRFFYTDSLFGERHSNFLVAADLS